MSYAPMFPEIEGRLARSQPNNRLPRPNAAGWIGPIHSPLRTDDEHPSFSVLPDSADDPGAFIDHGTGEHGSIADIARLLGVGPSAGLTRTGGGGAERGCAAHGRSLEVAMGFDDFCSVRRLDRAVLEKEWGIREAVHMGRPALLFPTPLGIDRVKFLDRVRPKNTWVCTGGGAHWYGLEQALRTGGETLYLVNGEPSVWAAHQEAVPAVCLATGEANPPSKNLINGLATTGFKLVRVVYDLDEAGRRGARLVVAALREAGLDAQALALPADLGEGGDVDDLHRRVGPSLRDALDALTPLEQEEGPGIILANVARESVQWLWPSRIPLGKLTVLDGDPGLGKSLLTLDLAARVSTGAPMPDGTDGVQGGVVLVTAEDGLADTVRPRLEAHGADLTRILALPHLGDGDERRPVKLPDDLSVVRQAIARVDAVLVVFDPLMAFLSEKVNSHRDQDVRRVLTAMGILAEETGAAIVIVRHLNKMADGSPLYRGGGSIGIIGAARAGFLVAKDPEEPNVRVLAPIKSNLGPAARSLTFTVDDIGGVPRLRWLGETDRGASELLVANPRGAEKRGPRQEAEEFLRQVLDLGPAPAKVVKDEASAAGFSWATVRRAAEVLGVKTSKQGAPGAADQRWLWALPDAKVLTGAEDAHPQCLSAFEMREQLRDEQTSEGVRRLGCELIELERDTGQTIPVEMADEFEAAAGRGEVYRCRELVAAIKATLEVRGGTAPTAA